MANKLKVWEIQDEAGKVYQIEGPNDATDEELFGALESSLVQPEAPVSPVQTAPDGAPPAPVTSPLPQESVEAAGPSGVQLTRDNAEFTTSIENVAAADVSDPEWMSNEERASIAQLMADPQVSYADINTAVGDLAEAKGLPRMGIMGGESHLQQYRDYLAKGGEAALPGYADWKADLAPAGPTATSDNVIARAYQDAVQYGTPGWIARTYHDWVGTGMDQLRQKFPNATEEQLEALQEDVINHVQRQVREANIEATEDDPLIPWLAGQVIGSAGIEDFIPGGGFAGQGVRGAAKRTGVAAATNTAADVGYQAADIAAGVQDQYNVEQTLLAPVIGGAFHAGIESVGGLARTVRNPKTPPPAPDSVAPIAVPTSSKRTKAYKTEIADTAHRTVDYINSITRDWTNAPEFEVYENFKKLDGIDNDAIGVTGPDGRVFINAEQVVAEAKALKVSPEDIVSSVTFHEGLGHYGLAQKFGDDLENILMSFYDNGSSTFRDKVDSWVARNPDAYTDDVRTVRAAEEVLAEMSEQGRMPVTFVNKITNMLKGFARDMGVDLKFSEREIRTILGMAHTAVVTGKGRDVSGNGFRYSKKDVPTALSREYEQAMMEYAQAQNLRPSQLLEELEGGTNLEAAATIGTRARQLGGETVFKQGSILNLGKLADENPGVVQFDRMWPHNQNIVDFRYVDPGTGSQVYGAFRQKGETAAEFEVYGEGRNSLGPKTVKEIRRQLKEQFPEIKKLTATRISGARHKGATVKYDEGHDITVQLSRYMKRRTRDVSDEEAMTNAQEILSGVLENYEPTYRSWAEAKHAARDRGLTAKQIRKAKGVGDLDRRLMQYDAVADATDQQLTALHEKMNDGTFTMRDKAKYLETVFSYNELLGRIFDDQAEIGRALNAMKALDFTKRKITDLNKLLEEHNGNNIRGFADDKTFNDFAEQVRYLMQTNNANGAHAMLKQAVKPYWWQYILSYRHASMLSGLGTHVKNAKDSAMMIARELEEQVMALPAGVIRSGLRAAGANVKEGVSPQEVAARLYGLIRTAFDGATYKATADAFVKGHGNTPYSSKIEMQDARIPVISKVQDTLHASDTFFRSFHTNANLYTLGVREARKQGFTGMAAFEEGSNLATNPTKDMLDESKRLADVSLLVDSPSAVADWVEAGKSIKPHMSAGQQAKAFFLNVMFPFFRVTDRLLFQSLRRSPLGFLDRVTREDLASGGARADIALARMAYGSALIYYYWQEAGEGNVEGSGPADHEKRIALEAGGYLPNSVREEDKYVDASGLNLSFLPDDLQNSVAANIATIRKAYESGKADGDSTAQGLGYAALSVLTVLASNSYAENISTYTAPFQENEDVDRDMAIANVGGSLASQFVPAAVRQYNQIYHDPIKRDTVGDKSIPDRIYGRVASAIPGLSDDLPAKYDVYGDQMQQGRTLSGINNYQEIKDDGVSVELQRLERTTENAVVRGAPASFEHEGERIKLTGAGKQEWQRVQGYYLRLGMSQTIQSDEWKNASDEDKIAIVKEIRTEAYDLTKDYMLPLLGVVADEEVDDVG